MKPNTFSVYNPDLRDSLKDSKSSKNLYSVNKNNEKGISTGTGFTSERSYKNPLQIANSQYLESKKTNKFTSPLTSPKGESVNYHSQRTLIPTPKLIQQNPAENLYKNISEKKSLMAKASQPLYNSSTINLMNTRMLGTDIKTTSHPSSIKESNASSVNNSSCKKSGGNSSTNTISNTSTPNTLAQQKSSYGPNDNSVYRRYVDNNQIEESISIENTEYSPIKVSQKNEKSNSKIAASTHMPKQDHLRKAFQSYSPNKFGAEKRADSKKCLSKGKNEPSPHKIMAEYIKNPALVQIENREIYERDSNGSTSIIAKEFGPESYSSLMRGLSSSNNLGYAKNATISNTLIRERERTLSPSIDPKNYIKSKGRLSNDPEQRRDNYPGDYSKKEPEESDGSYENQWNKKKNIGKYVEEKAINSNELYQFKHKVEEMTIKNDKENIKIPNDNLDMLTHHFSKQTLNKFFLQTSPKEEKIPLGRLDKETNSKISNNKQFDPNIKENIQSPKNLYNDDQYATEENILGLHGKTDSVHIDTTAMKSLEPKESKFINKQKSSYYGENNYESCNNKQQHQQQQSLLNGELEERNGINHNHQMGYMKSGVDKKYAETSRSKDSKIFELSTKQTLDNLKMREKQSGIYNNIPTTSTASSSLGIKEFKGNTGKIENSAEIYQSSKRNNEDKEGNSNSQKSKHDRELNAVEGSNTKNQNQIDDGNSRYGNGIMGLEMKKTFEKMRELLKFYQNQEAIWNKEKNELTDYISGLEQRLSRYEKDIQ